MGICLRRRAMNSRLRARGDPYLSVPLLVSGVPGGKLRTVRLGIRLGITSSNGAIPVDRCGWLLYAMVNTGIGVRLDEDGRVSPRAGQPRSTSHPPRPQSYIGQDNGRHLAFIGRVRPHARGLRPVGQRWAG